MGLWAPTRNVFSVLIFYDTFSFALLRGVQVKARAIQAIGYKFKPLDSSHKKCGRHAASLLTCLAFLHLHFFILPLTLAFQSQVWRWRSKARPWGHLSSASRISLPELALSHLTTFPQSPSADTRKYSVFGLHREGEEGRRRVSRH